MNYPIYMSRTKLKHLRQNNLGIFARRIQRPQTGDFSIRQFGRRGLLTARDFFGVFAEVVGIATLHTLRMAVAPVCIAGYATTLSKHVLDIVMLCAEEQMGRVYTGTHVAFMQYQQALRDGAVRQFPCDTMRQAVAIADDEFAVSVGADMTSPQPTIGGFINRGPKAFFEWYTFHSITPYPSSVQAGAVTAAPGFIMPNYTTFRHGRID